jgi:hypothetical protein
MFIFILQPAPGALCRQRDTTDRVVINLLGIINVFINVVIEAGLWREGWHLSSPFAHNHRENHVLARRIDPG